MKAIKVPDDQDVCAAIERMRHNVQVRVAVRRIEGVVYIVYSLPDGCLSIQEQVERYLQRVPRDDTVIVVQADMSDLGVRRQASVRGKGRDSFVPLLVRVTEAMLGLEVEVVPPVRGYSPSAKVALAEAL